MGGHTCRTLHVAKCHADKAFACCLLGINPYSPEVVTVVHANNSNLMRTRLFDCHFHRELTH
jgi:hypothetical protein